MQSGHGHSKTSCGADGVSYRVGDIVELEIEEDAAATGLHGLDHGGAFRRKKFQTDLAERGWLSKGIEETKGSYGVGNI
jgi:hypothetical protein